MKTVDTVFLLKKFIFLKSIDVFTMPENAKHSRSHFKEGEQPKTPDYEAVLAHLQPHHKSGYAHSTGPMNIIKSILHLLELNFKALLNI